MLQRLALRRHQQHPPARLHRDRFKGGKHRFRFEHHARTAAIGLIVNLAVAIGGVIAGVVGVQLGDAGMEGATDHPQAAKAVEHLRHQAHHIQPEAAHEAGLLTRRISEQNWEPCSCSPFQISRLRSRRLGLVKLIDSSMRSSPS